MTEKLKYVNVLLVLFLVNLSVFMIYLLYTERFKLDSIIPQLQPYREPQIAIKTKTRLKSFSEIYNDTSRIDFNWLVNNPVYKQFKIKPLAVRKRVTVLVIVSSGPRRVDRRNAIRKTWWTLCKPTGKVVPECIFITDHIKKGEKYYYSTLVEARKFKDLYFQHVPGGVTFGLRMLNHMVFAVSRYQFDYFLRVDDDYFMCFQNFLDEIPLPAMHKFHWGWVHRAPENIIRPEESMLLLSRDLIETFLLQDPNKILCHPWADQMIGEWSNTIDLKHVWRHDDRLWHHPPSRDEPSLLTQKNICHYYMGLHGAYPKHMLNFWKNRGEFKRNGGNLFTNSDVCLLTRRYEWHAFGYIWLYEPKPCIDNPTWDTSKQSVTKGSYTGREDT